MMRPNEQKSVMPKEVDAVEHHEIGVDESGEAKKIATMGTVTINDTEEIILVPAPSADPRGTVNLVIGAWFSKN